MRIDHVFYGHIGGLDPTAEAIERHIRAARRLRSEAVHELLREGFRRLTRLFRRRRAAKLQTC
jgi:hypothetical protein